MSSLAPWRRVGFWVVRELTGLALLVTMVVLIATMPPIYLSPDKPGAWIGSRVVVNTQFWGQRISSYVETVKAGSLGKSREGLPVGPLVATRLVNSLRLLGVALAVALVLGVAKGIADFRALGKKRFALGPALTGVVQGFPDFWLILMIQVGAVWLVTHLHWRVFPLAWIDEEPLASMVYPAFSITLVPWAYVTRITSTTMQHVYEQDYIRAARAKGLSEWVVLLKHALSNSLVPILDGLPNALAVMFASLLMAETMFDFPGIAATLNDAVLPPMRWPPLPPGGSMLADVPVLIASSVLLILVFWGFYLAIGLLRQIADPRLKGRDR